MNEVEIRITADDMSGPAFASAMGRLAALKKAADAVAKDRQITFDTTDALAKIAALKAAMGGVKVGGIDMSDLESSLMALRSKMQALGIADIADIDVQPGRLMTQLQLIKRLIQQAGISDIVGFNIKDSDLAAQLAKIHGLAETIPVRYDITGLGKLPLSMPAQNISDKFSIQGLDLAAQQLDQAKMQTDLFGQALNHLQSEKDALIEDINGGLIPSLAKTTLTTAATTRIFGGWGGILAGSIGGIGLWHLALDGALEATLSLGSAAAALTVGVATMVPTFQDVYTHLKAVQTVNSSLGSQIPPLTGQFDALAQAMSSRTIEAYGGALNLVNQNSGLLAKIAPQVVTGLDDWIAKIDLWSASQRGMGTILQNGVGFLHQFEGIVNSVGVSIANLIKADPGTAHFLLDIVGGAASLLEVVTKLPTPILATGLALHSFLLWGGAGIGLMSKLPGPLGAAGKAATEAGGHFGAAAGALRLLATSPWTWAAVGAASLGLLAYEGTQADNATKGFIASLDTGLANESASQAIGQIAVDMGRINSQMKSLNPSSFDAMGVSFSTAGYQIVGTWDALQKAASSFGSPGFWGSLGHLIEAPFTTGAASAVEYQNDISVLNNSLNALVGKQGNLFSETGKLMTQGYSYSQSLALMDMAGVKAGDSFALMQQKVANLITGYHNLSESGGMLTNAVNAVSFASLQQSSNVQTLNQGWDAFMSTIEGGESAFTGFAQQTIGLYQSLSTGGVKLSDSSGRVSASLALLASNAGSTKVSMTGLNSASLLAQQTFIQSASSANAQMDALTTLAAAAGLGTKGTDLLVTANKDLVSALLPAAGQSQTMTTILYALAQRGGYTGADSFKALSQWVGNTRNPMLDLQGVVGTLTQAAGNLTADVQNLSTALGTTLNDAMATAIFDATGGQKTFDNFATAILKTGDNSAQTRSAALNLAEGLYKLTGNTSDAQSEFETFAQKGLGLTKSQADTLWRETLPSLQGEINKLHGTTLGITVDANGYVDVNGYKISAGAYFSPHAAGGMITGGTAGMDSVPIMTMPGEVVVPTSMVNAGAIDHLRGYLPGFAAGGVVGNHGNLGMAFPRGAYNNIETDAIWATDNIASNAMKAFSSYVALQKAAASVPTIATAGSSGGIIATMMRNMAAQRGWTGTQWSALYDVEMREAGFNMTATNPTSGAYGLAQFINGPSEYAQYGGNSTTATGQITGMLNYIAQRYGNPENAWAHEQAYNWYDHGGILRPGATMAYNGTGQNEYVVGPQGLTVGLQVASGGSSAFESFMLEMIRNFVRVKGGGNVQTAFGRNK
jgi:hypothetical protein